MKLARVPLWVWPVLVALGGMGAAFNLLSFAFGEAPRDMLAAAFAGTWGTAYGVGQVLFKATPLIFTAVAFQVALRAGLFNIGAEGQLALASLVGAVVAARFPATVPAPLAVIFAMLVASATGAAVASVPGALRARLGVHEILSAIMMNRIVDGLLPWALVHVLGNRDLRTAPVTSARIAPLERLVPELQGSAASYAVAVAVAAAFATHAWLTKSRVGRELRWVGLNAEAARAERVPVERRLLVAMLLSGAIAGAGMCSTVLGYKGYYELGLGAGAGFSGIAVAMLGRGHPGGIVAAALLFGTLEQAGLAINARLPKDALDLLEAIVIVLVAASNRAMRPATIEGPR